MRTRPNQEAWPLAVPPSLSVASVVDLPEHYSYGLDPTEIHQGTTFWRTPLRAEKQ